MLATAFDPLAAQLRVAAGADHADLATKADVAARRTETKADVACQPKSSRIGSVPVTDQHPQTRRYRLGLAAARRRRRVSAPGRLAVTQPSAMPLSRPVAGRAGRPASSNPAARTASTVANGPSPLARHASPRRRSSAFAASFTSTDATAQ